MGLYVYLFGPSILGFVIGVILSIGHRANTNRHYRDARQKFEELVGGREIELKTLSDEIIRIFEEHRYKVIERSDEEIVFKHPPLIDPTAATIAFWTIITLGGFFGFFFAVHFFARVDERVSLRLVRD